LKITNTTILRAATFDVSQTSAAATSHTFIFPKDVVRQNGAGFPRTWGTNQGLAVPAYYDMSPDITSAPEYRDSIAAGLAAIPSLSLVMESEDLFGQDRGIYTHPTESGPEWERPGSLEFIDGDTNFHSRCGIRIQGGWNRRPEESPKHSFRLVFKKKYGAGKLRFPIFGTNQPAEFDNLILRAGCNNSWLHWSGVERRRAEFIRDQWMRDTMREMGQPSAAGIFVHLYLNGLYWGVYNLTERPDASFAAAHLGGKSEEFDSFNAEKLLEGTRTAWIELMRRVNKGVKTESDFESVSELLDVENFVDFMIANFYGANADWDRHSNWYAGRRREPPGKFQFFVWDAERTLERVDDNTMVFDDDESPPRIFHRLAENEQFRRLFSKRALRHFKGPLSPASSAARYRRYSDLLELPIIAEAARWGDYRHNIHRYKEGPYELYTPRGHWRPEVERLLNEYFPHRSAKVLEQFRAAGLIREGASD
jgi:hypothetical protein